MRFLFFLLYVTFLLAMPWLTTVDYFSGRVPRDLVVLVTGDQSRPGEMFASDVVHGIEMAEPHYRQLVPGLSFRFVQISLEDSRRTISRKLAREVARHRVVAIVSSDTSATVHSVLTEARILGLPVVVTVATADDLPTKGDRNYVRLPATNDAQAIEVERWLNSSRDGSPAPCAVVLYDDGVYGRSLKRSLLRRGYDGSMLTVTLGSQNDVSGVVLNSISKRSPDDMCSWIVIAYPEVAEDILAAKSFHGIPGPVLLSDAALGDWLAKLRDYSESVHITLPMVDPAGIDSTHKARTVASLPGYSLFGHDAAVLVARGTHQPGPRPGYFHLIESLPGREPGWSQGDDGLKMSYLFAGGENRKASFHTHVVAEGRSR